MQTNNLKTLDQQFTDKTGIDVSLRKRGVNLDPVVGMGVTRSIGSDSYPYTIVDILNVKGKIILKILSDYNEYEHNAPYETRDKEPTYITKENKTSLRGGTYESYVDIKWNEKTKRWNKGNEHYRSSVGERYYDLDKSF
jgi:hypothetical protein|tara:strand:+ start:245 stop:661 length:417 start_codon:yes stop_codon:yes gene_type:complete